MDTRAGLLIVMLCGCVAPDVGGDAGVPSEDVAPDAGGPLPICQVGTSGYLEPVCPEGWLPECGPAEWTIDDLTGRCSLVTRGRPACEADDELSVGRCGEFAIPTCLAPDPELRCPEQYWRDR